MFLDTLSTSKHFILLSLLLLLLLLLFILTNMPYVFRERKDILNAKPIRLRQGPVRRVLRDRERERDK
jgi:hypothetical protein